jgi:hypothetical protein
LRGTLVVAEVAIALLLLVGAGLLMRSFVRLQAVDPGFRPQGALAFGLTLPRGSTEPGPRRPRSWTRPWCRWPRTGVEAAGATWAVPFSTRARPGCS